MNALSPWLSAYPASPAPAVAFVLQDAGETAALSPVMQRLDRQGVDYCILATGTARAMLQGNAHLTPTVQDVAVAGQTSPGLGAWLQQQGRRAAQANICVTGLVSGFQKQWADFFRQSGRRVVGYYDGFRVRLNPAENPANAFQGALTDLITPSADTAAYFKSYGFGNIPVSALGQPSLESIASAVRQTDSHALAQQLGLRPGQPTLLFVGQYGPDYAQAFRLLCQTVRQLPNVNCLVALHPSIQADGRLESAIIQQYGLQRQMQIIPKQIATAQALSVADVVLTHHSTMATQAFLQGKPVILVGADKPDSFDPLQARGLAPRCTTPSGLLQALQQTGQPVAPESLRSASMRFQRLGIPSGASERITAYLLNIANAFNMNQRRQA